jgi:enterochelin esterase family protein
MIVQQSPVTAMAERPIGNQKPVISSSSPTSRRSEAKADGGVHGTRPFSRAASTIFNLPRLLGFKGVQANSSSFKAIQAPPPGVYKKTAKIMIIQKHKALPESNLQNSKLKIPHSKLLRKLEKNMRKMRDFVCRKNVILSFPRLYALIRSSMKLIRNIFAIFLLSITSTLAQPVVSPEVHADGSVTFRLPATNAVSVLLHCEGVTNSPGAKGTLMQKGTDGVWTFTTQPLAPDIYSYSFTMDGVDMIDPNNPFEKYNLRYTTSQVEVPGPDSLPWQIADVPHGELHRHLCKSAIANDEHTYTVYTPPGYNPASHKRYPVLYLLHGYTDDDTAWAQAGRANIILDNLIARGQAKPMIVVMPLGYGAPDILKVTGKADTNVLWQINLDRFSNLLLNEVMPRVQKEYHVSTDAKETAITGLSMGGAESLIVGLNHPNRFAWIGAFSTGGLTNYPVRFPTLNADANKKLRLVWVACGHDDGLYQGNKRFCEWLDGRGVRYTWVEMPGIHSYRVWRPFLTEFLPLLFQDSK